MDKTLLSERPGSNWRHSAWKADALPTELLSLIDFANIKSFLILATIKRKINKIDCLFSSLLKNEIQKCQNLHCNKTYEIFYFQNMYLTQ